MTLLPSDGAPAPWRLASLVDLHWRRWDDEWLVFDGGSGKTHKIDTPTALALMVLESGPAAEDSIAAAIARELGLVADASLSSRLADLLDELRQLGLVTPPNPS